MFTTKQKRNRFLLVLAVSLLAWCMPCFSFAPRVTGYQWGIYTFGYTGLQQLAVLLLCVKFWQSRSRWLTVLTMGLLATVPLVYLAWLPTWHTNFVTGKVSWQIGLSTVYPGYWAALGLSLLPLIAFWLLKEKTETENKIV